MLSLELLVPPAEQSISSCGRKKGNREKNLEEINRIGEADLYEIVKLCEVCLLFFLFLLIP